MPRRVLVPVVLSALLALGACGGSGSSKATTASGDQGRPTPSTYQPAGVNPSKSAKMVCEKEVKSEVAQALQTPATRVTAPIWKDHIYSCTYFYPTGSIVISVKELVSDQATTAYFDGLAKKLGRAQKLVGLGQGAFVAKNDNTVVRKDYKVLRVEVHPTATPFIPAMTVSDVATNVAVAIMGCWVGA